MGSLKNRIVSELVVEDYRFAAVFQSYGIDFCCNGHISVDEACKKNDVSLDELEVKIDSLKKEENHEGVDYANWPIDLLADYIQKRHHTYVEEKVPVINAYLDKLCQVHGTNHPELIGIRNLFKESGGDLATHMKKEELMLFPYIRKMVKACDEKAKVEIPLFKTVENPIAVMQHEHDNEGERFRKIRLLSNDYKLPAEACNTYRITFEELKAFERDLHLHVHLENNILFPKAIAMEKAFQK